MSTEEFARRLEEFAAEAAAIARQLGVAPATPAQGALECGHDTEAQTVEKWFAHWLDDIAPREIRPGTLKN